MVIKVISTAKGVNYYLGMIGIIIGKGIFGRKIDVPSKNPAGKGIADREKIENLHLKQSMLVKRQQR